MRTDTLRTDTAEAGFPWAIPSVPTRHLVFRARLRRRRNRFAASLFVADVRRGYRRALAILGALAVVYAAVLVLRGCYVAALMLGVAQ